MKGDDLALIVMDLEWTAWEGSSQRHWTGPGEEMEIVQIGAVRLADTPALEELSAFEILVRPRINPTLDRYFTDLTGITQDRLDRDGVDLKTGLGEFAEFIGPSTEAFGFGDEFTHIVTNCQLYGLANPFADCRCADVRPAVMAHLGINWVPNSSELPGLMDFTPPGAKHQGLADSRCVAEALRRARKAGRF
ncbi:3'-5' exonuclease [Thalassospiraceae bacterium LMO-SO8]|nr:exonuclease domain-containing protein [Alphaproteobacteria bacterium LMO-S08]WND76078.1 3'-5' exonuclease [Thalassospiraceae bacterium LMO-SO8]